MLLRTPGGRSVPLPAQTKRAMVPWTDTSPLRFRLMEQRSTSGVSVTSEASFGLPTFVECVRQPAQMLATLDWNSWDWTTPSIPTMDHGSWLADLIEFPGFGSKFDMFQDISASIDGWGGALVQKIRGVGKDRGKVVALKLVDPDQWQVAADERGNRVFKVKVYEPGTKTRTEAVWTDADALYIRGFNPTGFLAGQIPWQLYRNTLGNILAIEEFSANWWKNQGAISTYISHPDKLSPTQAEEILDIFEETHGGLENAGKPALLSGGAKLERVNVTAEDAQLSSSRSWSVEEICRMMNWDPGLVNAGGHQGATKTEEMVLRATKIYLLPRVRRIRDAFNADPDLFRGQKFWLDARFTPLDAADSNNQSNANLRNRQAGIVTANELRAPMGLPPRPDGDQLQLTPVGGAANPNAGTDDGVSDPDSGAQDVDVESGGTGGA